MTGCDLVSILPRFSGELLSLRIKGGSAGHPPHPVQYRLCTLPLFIALQPKSFRIHVPFLMAKGAERIHVRLPIHYLGIKYSLVYALRDRFNVMQL